MTKETGLDRHDEVALLATLFVAFGWAAHRLRPILDGLSRGWRELASYAVGGIMVIICFPMMFRCLLRSLTNEKREGNYVLIGTLALSLVFGSIGLGTVLGWLVSSD